MTSTPTEPRKSLRPHGLVAADQSPLHNLRYDLPAGLVVFLVALPLCLGVALASGAPLLAGLIAGCVGGLVIPLISRSALSVSGPAAGLTAIVASGVERLGSFEAVCGATIIAGVLQFGFGAMRAGVVASFIPSAVIRGMLSAIGILLLLKQLPHAIGYDQEAFDSDSFIVAGGGNTFTVIARSFRSAEFGAVIISAVALVILVAFEKVKALKSASWLPAALVAVVTGTALNEAFRVYAPALLLGERHLVQVPAGEGSFALLEAVTPLGLGVFADSQVWVLGVTLAIVASLETLLSLDAIDKLDPFRRRSDPNRELIAQGVANSISGGLGGLPVTSVIVRSSANVNSGARTRAAAFSHGAFLLLAVVFAGALLNRIPLAALASILLVTGYKLAQPSVFIAMKQLGNRHFVPFVVTIVSIVLTDLLRGIAIGIVIGILFTIRESMKGAFEVVKEEEGVVRLRFLKDIHFFHKAAIMDVLETLQPNTLFIVDRGASDFVERDVVESLCEFRETASSRGVEVEFEGIEPVKTIGGH